jgi:hypothetical protein
MAKLTQYVILQDHYRDVMVRGGIPQVAFGNWMQGKLGRHYFMSVYVKISAKLFAFVALFC